MIPHKKSAKLNNDKAQMLLVLRNMQSYEDV